MSQPVEQLRYNGAGFPIVYASVSAVAHVAWHCCKQGSAPQRLGITHEMGACSTWEEGGVLYNMTQVTCKVLTLVLLRIHACFHLTVLPCSIPTLSPLLSSVPKWFWGNWLEAGNVQFQGPPIEEPCTEGVSNREGVPQNALIKVQETPQACWNRPTSRRKKNS